MKKYCQNILFIGLITLCVGVAFAENSTSLPAVKLTDSAITQAKVMLSEEHDSRAVLTLIKGNFEVVGSADDLKEERSGWMLQVVNREQFQNEPRKNIRGLEILLPQGHLYPELEGSTLDYSGSWWILETRE